MNCFTPLIFQKKNDIKNCKIVSHHHFLFPKKEIALLNGFDNTNVNIYKYLQSNRNTIILL